MSKITLSLEDMKTLLQTAKENNKLEHWSDLAVEWMEFASAKVHELNQKIKKMKGK